MHIRLVAESIMFVEESIMFVAPEVMDKFQCLASTEVLVHVKLSYGLCVCTYTEQYVRKFSYIIIPYRCPNHTITYSKGLDIEKYK